MDGMLNDQNVVTKRDKLKKKVVKDTHTEGQADTSWKKSNSRLSLEHKSIKQIHLFVE